MIKIYRTKRRKIQKDVISLNESNIYCNIQNLNLIIVESFEINSELDHSISLLTNKSSNRQIEDLFDYNNGSVQINDNYNFIKNP